MEIGGCDLSPYILVQKLCYFYIGKSGKIVRGEEIQLSYQNISEIIISIISILFYGENILMYTYSVVKFPMERKEWSFLNCSFPKSYGRALCMFLTVELLSLGSSAGT